jgi:hypothetical protein
MYDPVTPRVGYRNAIGERRCHMSHEILFTEVETTYAMLNLALDDITE